MLSFELGLLFPRFMGYAGAIIGMPFSLEGFAFVTEAIFLGIYLYGWNRISPKAHIFAGAVVALSGAALGIFVVIANAWMNTPTGFRLIDGRMVDIDPIAAMMNPHAFPQTLHMTLAAYCATGFVVAGIHAFMLLRDKQNRFHERALSISLIIGGISALLMPLSGDILAKAVAVNQPVKFAALEGQFETVTGAPLRIGGIPDEESKETRYAIEIPCMLRAGVRRSEYGSSRLERISERRASARRHRPFRVSNNGRLRNADDSGCCLGSSAMVARAKRQIEGLVCFKMVFAGFGFIRAARIYRHRNRLDGHGSRQAALDYLRRNADGGCGYADAGTRRAVRHLYDSLHFSGGNYDLASSATSRC